MSTITDYQQQAIDFLNSTSTEFTATFKEFSTYFDGEKDQRNIFNCTLSNKRHSFKFTFGQSISSSTIQIDKPQTEVNDIIEVYAGLSFANKGVSVGTSFKIYKSNNFDLPYEEIEKMALSMQNDYIIRSNSVNKKWVDKFNNGDISRNLMKSKIIDANTPIGSFEQCIMRAIKRECEKLVPVNIKGDKQTPPSAYDVLSCLQKYEVGTFDNFCSEFGYDTDSRTAYKTYKAVMKEWKNVELLFTPEQLELLQEIS